MIACVKCGNELPDGALHCVFCGARQAVGSQVPPPAAGEDKTVMHRGRAAGNAPHPVASPAMPAPGDISGAKTIGVTGDLVRQVLDNLPEPPPAAPPAGGFGAPPPAAPPAGGFGEPPPAAPPAGGFGAPPPAAAPHGGGAWGAPPPSYPPPAGPGGSGQPWGGPGMPASPFEAPAGVQPPRNRLGPPAAGASEMATMIAQPRAVGTPPAGPGGAPMMPAGGPPGMPHGPPSLPPGMMPPMVPQTPGMPPGPARPMDGPVTVALSPGHFQQHTPPPYLASRTLERMGAPQEPWAGLLGTLLLVFGIGLIACFVLPWSIGDQVSFSWTAIAHSPGAAKLAPLLIGVTGVLAVVFGLLPLETVPRGIAAAATAGLALMLQSLVVAGFSTAGLFSFLTALTLISGLLLRSQYQAALLPRVLTTAGVVFFLMLLLVPGDGQVPVIAHIKAVANVPGRMKIVAVLVLFWDLVPFLGLLCWLPAPGAAGTKLLAWLLITQPVIMALMTGVLTPYEQGLTAGLMAGIYPVFLAPVATMAWLALLGYGVATVAGKQLEHP